MRQKVNPDLYVLMNLFLIVIILSACRNRVVEADAYGNFEAVEVVVGAEGTGRLLYFNAREGETVKANQVIGVVDTTLLVLSRDELSASLQAVAARRIQLSKTIEIHKSRISILQKEVNRVTKMYEAEAATLRDYDEITGKLSVAKRELEMVESQESSLRAEEAMIHSKRAVLNEQLRRCRVFSPIDGTILQKYTELGEMVSLGKPLFKVAETSHLILRVYISGRQLHALKIGEEVNIRYDIKNDEMAETSGVISWIASSAEFTPKIIQTKEDRVDLVYAVKIIVPNEKGEIKIGMPGEMVIKQQ